MLFYNYNKYNYTVIMNNVIADIIAIKAMFMSWRSEKECRLRSEKQTKTTVPSN